MSTQTTSPEAGASGGVSNALPPSSRTPRYYPPHFQPHQHYPSQPLLGINPHSVIASTIPITTSLPTAAINEEIIASGAISGALPITLAMGTQTAKGPKTAASVGVTAVGSILSTTGTVLSSAAVSPSSTVSGNVSTSSGNSSSIITGLPYGIIMDSSDVNEVVGGGAEVLLGGDSLVAGVAGEGQGGFPWESILGINGIKSVDVNGNATLGNEENTEGDYSGDGCCASSRSSSADTVVPIPDSPDETGNRLVLDSGVSSLEGEIHEESPKSQLGAWKDLRLVYAIVRILWVPEGSYKD